MPDLLLIGDTVRSPELRHEVPVEIGDPFLYAEVGGRRVAIVWSVEGDRIAAVDPTIEIVPSETFPLDELLRDGPRRVRGHVGPASRRWSRRSA